MTGTPSSPCFASRLVLLAGAGLLLSACSAVQGWFPDKQKQYQYSADIPALEIPPELDSSTIDGVPQKPPKPWSSASAEEDSRPELRATQIPPGPKSEMSVESARAYKATSAHQPPILAQSSDNSPLIEVQAPIDIAWAEVNKALGRLKLEVSDLNRSDATYFVHYGGKPHEDKGFFGEVSQMFSQDDPDGSREYRVKLEQTGPVTSVQVLNPQGEPQREGPGLELLKKLHDAMQTTQPGGGGPEKKPGQ